MSKVGPRMVRIRSAHCNKCNRCNLMILNGKPEKYSNRSAYGSKETPIMLYINHPLNICLIVTMFLTGA